MSATQRDAIRYFCQQKGMTEEELAKKINKAFEQPTGEELIHVLNKGAAIGRREMLDKASTWLANNAADYVNYDGLDENDYAISTFDAEKLVSDFKKAMVEQ